MRISVIIPDNTIIKDGVGYSVTMPVLTADTIRAIQFYDTYAEIEHVSGVGLSAVRSNEIIGTAQLAAYRQPFVDAWQAAHEAFTASQPEGSETFA